MCRPVSGHAVYVLAVEANWAMVTNLRAAPWHRYSTMHAAKFFVPMNGVCAHLCTRRTVQQCANQTFAIQRLGILDASHSGDF